MQINLKNFLYKYNVEIPMLQRDYAQGRKSKENIAKDFLEKIFEVLKGKTKNLHIDFIYGYRENDKFILVDGQQRITTLWLIHFMIYKMNNKFDDIKESLKNFSYSVRESSKKFCKNLIIKPLIINGNPKNIILNQGGIFGKDLDNDPTIKAILNMLDLIYIETSKLSKDELENAFDNLDKITFSIFDMKDYGLGEELYIKMNARGKQLSLYENIKAYIQKGLDFEENFKLLSSIDNEWSNFLFDIKNINKFDNRGLIFLYYSTLFFILKSDKIKEEEELSNYLPNDVSKNIKYSFFDILKEDGNLKLLDNTIKILNKYSKEKPLNNFVEKFDRKYLLNKDICYFYALLLFVSKIENIDSFDKKAFNDYYRVCKHLIENHRVDEYFHIKKFFDLFNKLSDGYNDIYEYLSKDKKGSEFHTEIYKLEKRKAKLILKNRENKDSKEKWEEILNKTSDNDFLVGWVNFLLDFSNDNFNEFKEYAELTIDIIGKLNNDEFLNLFQRALLTFGDYGFYSTNYYYGNKPQINIFRDREAWNWLLSGKKDNNKYFKELLDSLLKETNGTLEEKLDLIIDKVNIKDKEWFEYLLIKEAGLFEFITENGGVSQKCGRIKKFDKDMLLLYTVQARKWAIDLFTYSFYLYIKKLNIIIDVSNIEYNVEYERHSSKRNKNSYFKINNKNVICDSMNSKIQIGSKKYDVNLSKGSDIFSEFEGILKKCKIIK